jgi:hypothetical protein
MSYLRVEGHSKLLKDPRTGVIINDDVQEIEGARKRKARKKEMENEIVDLKAQVDRLTTIIEQLVER